MPFVQTQDLEPWERRPGWVGRTFHTEGMTLAVWEFSAGSDVHQHQHSQEEVWFVIEGELEVSIGEETRTVGAGAAAVVPSNTPHALHALSDGRAIVVDQPRRSDEAPRV